MKVLSEASTSYVYGAAQEYEFPDFGTTKRTETAAKQDTTSGAHTPSGALKYDDSKADLSLLPLPAMEAEARALMYGEKKYGRDNWRLGMESHRLVAAALRHIHAYNEGEDNDQESGVSHLGHARACLGMLLGTIAAGTAKDTRPARPINKEKKS